MPTDVDAELAESFERLNAALLAEYLREPRRIRRSVSRDLARQHPVAPKRPQYGAVGRWVNKRRPMPKRFDGIMVALGEKTPHSGQARINAKRQQRAEFWRTVKIHVHPDLEQPFREHLHLLGHGARVHSRRALDWIPIVELDVHIPDAPAAAVKADPVYSSNWTGERYEPRLSHVVWYDADGWVVDHPLGGLINALHASATALEA